MTSEDFTPNPTLTRLYPESEVGGFSRADGHIEFYTRVNALIDQDSRVLDFGAGRGHWAVDSIPAMSRKLRWLRGRVAEVVGTDVEDVVLSNPSLDTALVTKAGEPLPFEDGTFDLIIADYVLEHVEEHDAPDVVRDLMRVLKPGGWFAARTPNKWGMIGMGARFIPNRWHVRLLSRLQPGRKEEDVFPTRYSMNTRRDLRRLFAPHGVYVYGHTSEPTYFGTSPTAWRFAAGLGRLTPPAFAPTLMIFVRKVE